MTIKQALETVRIALGDRDEHHVNCSFRQGKKRPCDCYAAPRQVPHRAMDIIEDAIRKAAQRAKL